MEALAQDCSLSVVPLRVGGGTRIKILHAMAMGLPVVSTPLGCEGLEAEDGEQLLIRATPEAFAQAVLALDGDRELRQKLRAAGRSLVESRYDWQKIYQDYEAQLIGHQGRIAYQACINRVCMNSTGLSNPLDAIIAETS